jgi:hypothetical protein
MTGCPYTWFKGLFAVPARPGVAAHLRVTVRKEQTVTVDVSLPARSAGWLIELIPGDVVSKIKEEGIPLEEIQADLASRAELAPQKIFELVERHRSVSVWLE